MKKEWIFLALLSSWPTYGVEHYAIHEHSVVDNFTGLEWQRGISERLNQNDAKKYCEELTLAQKTDWRLPAIKELSTLIDVQRRLPSIDKTAFPDSPSLEFASSTTFSTKVWGADFVRGVVHAEKDEEILLRARCVR